MNDAELRARTEAALAIPLQVALHARPVDPDRPADGLEFPVTGLALNPGGTLHAGALGAIMELTGLLVLLPALAANEHAVTHHIATQILSAGPGRRRPRHGRAGAAHPAAGLRLGHGRGRRPAVGPLADHQVGDRDPLTEPDKRCAAVRRPIEEITVLPVRLSVYAACAVVVAALVVGAAAPVAAAPPDPPGRPEPGHRLGTGSAQAARDGGVPPGSLRALPLRDRRRDRRRRAGPRLRAEDADQAGDGGAGSRSLPNRRSSLGRTSLPFPGFDHRERPPRRDHRQPEQHARRGDLHEVSREPRVLGDLSK